MRSMFYLAALLLGLDGILHLVKVFAMKTEPIAAIPTAVTLLFGAVYLVIAFFLVRLRDPAFLWGFIAALVGLALALIGMKPSPDTYTIAFIVLDVLAILFCGYMFFINRGTLKRVH